MSRRYYWHPERREWVEPHERLVRNVRFGRAPMVISGTLDYVLNHADGKIYTDKRQYERAVIRAGCEIVGNERMPEPKVHELPDAAPDVAQAMEQLGY